MNSYIKDNEGPNKQTTKHTDKPALSKAAQKAKLARLEKERLLMEEKKEIQNSAIEKSRGGHYSDEDDLVLFIGKPIEESTGSWDVPNNDNAEYLDPGLTEEEEKLLEQALNNEKISRDIIKKDGSAYSRSDKEMIGIQRAMNKKAEMKKIKEKEKRLKKKQDIAMAKTILDKTGSSHKSKMKNNTRRLHTTEYIEDLYVEEEEVKVSSFVPWHNKKEKSVVYEMYTQEERQAWAKAKLLQKQMKRKAKIKRREQRRLESSKPDIKTESEHLNIQTESFVDVLIRAPLNMTKSFTEYALTLGTPELLRQLGWIDGGANEVPHTIMYVIMMIKSPDKLTDTLLTWQYMLAIGGSEYKTLPSMIELGLIMWNRQRERKIKTEALSDKVDAIGSTISSLISGEAVNAIRQIILLALSWKFFHKDTAHKIMAYLGKPEKRQFSILETVELMTSCISKLLRMGEMAMRGFPLSSILFSNDPLSTALGEAKYLLARADNLYTGLPRPGAMCAKDFVKQSSDVLGILMKYDRDIPSWNPKATLIASAVSNLGLQVAQAKSKLEKMKRPTPMIIVVVGPPGIGKSSVMTYIYQLFSRVKGRKFHPNQVYKRIMTSQYWEGYDPYETFFVYYAEAGATAEHIARIKGDEIISELLAVADSNPYTCDMANVNKKGEVHFTGEMIMMDTNNDTLNVHATMKYPGAIYRRMLFVRPVVKKECKKAGSHAIDPYAYTQNYYDKWNFDVFRRNPLENGVGYNEEYLMKASDKESDITAFGKLMTKEVTDHIAKEEKNMNETNKDIDFSYLDMCTHDEYRYECVLCADCCHNVPFETCSDCNPRHCHEHSYFIETCTKCQVSCNHEYSAMCDNCNMCEHNYPKLACPLCHNIFCSKHSSYDEECKECDGERHLWIKDADKEYRKRILELSDKQLHQYRDVAVPILQKSEYEDFLCQTIFSSTDDDVLCGDQVDDVELKDDISDTELVTEAKHDGQVVIDEFKKLDEMEKEIDSLRQRREAFLGAPENFALKMRIASHMAAERQAKENMDKALQVNWKFRLMYSLCRLLWYFGSFSVSSMVKTLAIVTCFMSFVGTVGRVLTNGRTSYVFFLIQLGSMVTGLSLQSAILTMLVNTNSEFEDCETVADAWGVMKKNIHNSYMNSKQKAKVLFAYVKGVTDVSLYMSPRTQGILLILGTTTTGLGVLYYQWKKHEKKTKSKEIPIDEVATCSEASNFKNPTEASKELNAIEDKLFLGGSYKRVAVKNQMIWNTLVEVPASFYGDLDSFAKGVQHNQRKCTIYGKDWKTSTYALGICGNVAIMNKHAFPNVPNEEVLIRVSASSRTDITAVHYETRVYPEHLIPLHSDLVLVVLECVQFRDILDKFPDTYFHFTNAEGKIGTDSLIVHSFDQKLDVYDDKLGMIPMERLVTYQWPTHGDGMCGLPVCAKTKGCYIVGIHSAGDKNGSDLSFGIMALKPEIEKALEKVYASSYFVSTSMKAESKLYGTLPHFKSPVTYVDFGHIGYRGKIRNPNMRQVSKLTTNLLSEDLHDLFLAAFNFIPDKKYVKPLMQPKGTGLDFKSPWNYGLDNMSGQRMALNQRRLVKTLNQCYERIRDNLRNAGNFKLQPLDVLTAMNGDEIDCFLRRMDMSKAAGFGTPGKKYAYVTRHYEEGNKVVDEPIESLTQEIVDILNSLMKGESCEPVSVACLKDEPRPVEKKDKTRIFYSSPFAFLIVQRMFLGPLYTLMNEFSDAFYCAIGINAHRDWADFYNKLNKFNGGRNKKFEGDYSKYDTSMPYAIGAGVAWLICSLLKEFGYSDEHIMIVNGILSDEINALVDFAGELLVVPGLQTSGKYGTAENNCLRNLIIALYIWNSIPETKHLDFFEYVLLVTYGDDVAGAIADEVTEHYNAVSYSEVCAREVGLKFTNSSKTEVNRPFVTEEEMTFLMRHSAPHPVSGVIVGKLSLNSIYKSLYWTLPSGHLSRASHMEATINSSLRELFFHCDPDQYDIFREFFMTSMLNKYPSGRFMFLEYETLYEELWPDLMDLLGGWKSRKTEHISTESKRYMENASCEKLNGNNPIRFGRRRGNIQWPANKINNVRNKIMEYEDMLKTKRESFKNLKPMCRGFDYGQVKQMPMYQEDHYFRDMVDEYFTLLADIRALDLTIKRLWNWVYRAETGITIVTESENISVMNDDRTENKDNYENVLDIGGAEKAMQTVGVASGLNTGQRNLLNMNEFLARPLAIGSMNLAVHTDLTYSIDIWDAFLDHPTIRSKLRNYAYLRGNLMVRVTVSGCPFHSGKLQMSYQPFAADNENLNYLDGLLAGASRLAPLIYLSQSRGVKVIDVKENQPVDMMCGYINVQPMIRLFNVSPLILPDGSPFNDAVSLGKLYLNTLNQVKCTSATPSDISIFIYAWMVDVELGAPTGTVIEVGTESKDERESGPVERYATRASEIAAALTSVPVIAPFARASNMVFKGVASLSALFGFSVPTVIDKPVYVKNKPFQNSAQVIGYGTGERITLDPKQELTIDPRVVGTDEDEMSISYLCGVESLLDTFTWAHGTTPLNSAIWMCPVTPRVCKRFSLGAPDPYLLQPTPLCLAATPFEFWRGSITYRFEIVTSAFHRGKLAFYFEPNISQNVVIDTVLDMNKQYIVIVDLQETTDVTFKVEWAFPKAWARNIPNDLIRDVGAIGFLGTDYAPYANGYIAVTPFTSLQSPDNSDIEINVYISSDDMMFNQLTPTRIPTLRPATESKRMRSDMRVFSSDESDIEDEDYDWVWCKDCRTLVHYDVYYDHVRQCDGQIEEATDMKWNVAEHTWDIHLEASMEDADIHEIINLNKSSASVDHINEEHFGEMPVSFRGLCKRFTSFQGYDANTPFIASGGTVRGIAYRRSIFPPITAGYTGVASTNYPNLLGYLRYAYLGMRGSMKHRISIVGSYGVAPLNSTKISLANPDTTSYPTLIQLTDAQISESTLTGTVQFMPITNAGIEFETPMYTNNLFGISFSTDPFPASNSNVESTLTRDFIATIGVTSLSSAAYLNHEMAAGEDFTFLRFQGAPPFMLA